MKIISFNVNSIRSRLHQLAAVIDKHLPDIIALQETKVQDKDFPRDDIASLGYQAVWFGQKTHYGVALLSRIEPFDVQYGFEDDGDSAQKRLISASYRFQDQDVRIINGYFPQGENRSHPVKFANKEMFYEKIYAHLKTCYKPEEGVLLVGDMNVAPHNKDIGIGDENAKRWLRTGKCSFLPEEREWYQRLCSWGLSDAFRQCHPTVSDLFSWFDYRSRGFDAVPPRGLRIDHILASQGLVESCVSSGIDYDIRAMDKPSDHAPVWAKFSL